jgi:hypothetical protein
MSIIPFLNLNVNLFKSFFTCSLHCGSRKERNYIAGGERIFLLGVPEVITHFTISITSVHQERIYVNGLITLYASVSIIFLCANTFGLGLSTRKEVPVHSALN